MTNITILSALEEKIPNLPASFVAQIFSSKGSKIMNISKHGQNSKGRYGLGMKKIYLYSCKLWIKRLAYVKNVYRWWNNHWRLCLYVFMTMEKLNWSKKFNCIFLIGFPEVPRIGQMFFHPKTHQTHQEIDHVGLLGISWWGKFLGKGQIIKVNFQ